MKILGVVLLVWGVTALLRTNGDEGQARTALGLICLCLWKPYIW